MDGRVFFQAYSDSRLVRGILALLLEVVDGRPVEEVAAANLHFVETIGLDRELSPSRAKGLKLLVGRIRSFEAEG
ncbi:MAG: SufE family protein [Myxococcota bacterium]